MLFKSCKKKTFIKRCILPSGLEWLIVHIERSQVIIISELKQDCFILIASSEDPDVKLHCFAKVLTYREVSLTRYHLNDQRDVWLHGRTQSGGGEDRGFCPHLENHKWL